MIPIAKTLRLEKKEYYSTHLCIINCLLPIKITNKEIEVLALFMCLHGVYEHDRFGTTAKKIIRESLSLSHQSLCNYIGSLTKKKMLIINTAGIYILPILQPDKDQQVYMIKLINIE